MPRRPVVLLSATSKNGIHRFKGLVSLAISSSNQVMDGFLFHENKLFMVMADVVEIGDENKFSGG